VGPLALSTSPSWTADPALIWVLCAGLLYWLGGRSGGVQARAAGPWRTLSFIAGLAAIVAALGSPIDRLAEQLFWVHMAQHILLIAVAPPLLALARPWSRIWRGPPLAFRRRTAGAVMRDRAWAPVRRAARLLAQPLPSWLLFNLTFLAWHLPGLYDAALQTPLVHAFEHAVFFFTALLFWTRVIDSPPWRSPLSDAGRIAYLASTMIAGWILAIVLALSSSPIYAGYADAAARPGGISALTDQQLAAGMMWVPGSLAYSVAILVIAYRWLEPRGGRRPAPIHPLAKSP
jgi:cytochrome c oxidase assembly factor CtaG